MKNEKKVEHDDLEERFQISAEIEFSIIDENYIKLSPMEIEIKKIKKNEIQIENVELRKPRSGLF